MYKQLAHNDLTKRGGARITIFINKIRDSVQFITTKGLITLDKKQTINDIDISLDDLETAMKASGFSAEFKGKNEKGTSVTVKYPRDFFKSPDLGGKGQGAGTKAEDAELTLFRKRIEDAIAASKKQYITIAMNGRDVKVAGVISTPGPGGGSNTPKADFTLIDYDGKHVAWISHKAGTKASSFQQYGGLTADSIFSNDKETKKFMNDLATLRPDGLKSGETFWRPIQSKTVALHSVYGRDYGKQPGIFNCDEFHLGPMTLKKTGSKYVIESLHKGTNGDVPTKDFAAVFIARYDNSSYKAAGVTVKKCRVGVFAAGKVHSKARQI